MPGSVSDSDLHEQLARWAAEHLISGEQAAQIEAAEAARGPAAHSHAVSPPPAAGPAPPAAGPAPPAVVSAPPAAGPAPPAVVSAPPAVVSAPPAAGPAPPAAAAPASHRLPLVVEALGYVGGVLAILGGVLAVGALWPVIPDWAALLLAGAATVALATGGALVHAGADPAFGRLRSGLWLMATVGLAGFAVILTSQVWHFSALPSSFASFAAGTVLAAAFWWLTRSAAQQLALFAGAATVTSTGIAWAAYPDYSPWASGLGLWLLSALWGLAVIRGYLGTRWAGYLAAGLGLLIGAQLTMEEAAGQVLAIVTVAGLVTVGVLLRRVLVVVLGAVGALVVVPQIATRYLPSSAAAPLSVLVVALVVLGCALWLAKRWRPGPR